MGKLKPEHYPADLYAAVHIGNPGDIGFYLDACAGTDTVLELGCGSGRIARVLIEAGHEVVGLDRDREALAVAAGFGVHTIAGDFTEFTLKRHFERIIIPYNGLYCLLSEAEMVSCLRSVERHLAAEGMLIFDVFSGDQIADDRAAPIGVNEWVATRFCAGRLWEVFENSEIHSESQRVDATYTHTAKEDGKIIVATIRSRYLLSCQIPELLSQAGLTLAAFHGGFDQSPFHPESDFFVVRATR